MIHTCKSLHTLRRVRSVTRNKMEVHVENGAKVLVLAVGIYPLALSSGLVIELNNCYYFPVLNRNIISLMFGG
jgi:hypothetical protein